MNHLTIDMKHTVLRAFLNYMRHRHILAKYEQAQLKQSGGVNFYDQIDKREGKLTEI